MVRKKSLLRYLESIFSNTEILFRVRLEDTINVFIKIAIPCDGPNEKNFFMLKNSNRNEEMKKLIFRLSSLLSTAHQ